MVTLLSCVFLSFIFTFVQATSPTNDTNDINFHQRYHKFEDIQDFIRKLQLRYPKSLEVRIIGETYEGRPIKALEITPKDSGVKSSDQKGVFLECGIHAREWITPASCLWVAEQLLKMDNGEELDEQFKKFKIPRHIKFFIIPNLNPDGYVYTWTTNRWWRKNRVPHKTNSNETIMCHGTDLNRNADYKWQPHAVANNTEEVDISYCQWTYPGREPFSEKETQALRDFVFAKQAAHSILAYIAVHSYSQQILFPYGYTKRRSNDYVEHRRVAVLAQQAIKSIHGKEYEAGQSYGVSYQAHGETPDYFYEIGKIRYSFLIELRPDGYNDVSFLLPHEEIVPTAQELWAAVSTIVSNAINPDHFSQFDEKMIKLKEESVNNMTIVKKQMSQEMEFVKTALDSVTKESKVLKVTMFGILILAFLILIAKLVRKHNKGKKEDDRQKTNGSPMTIDEVTKELV